MKKEIHPTVYTVKAHCVCGTEFQTTSTKQNLDTSLCSGCHPFFTGQQKFVDTAGRIEKFNAKFKKNK